MFGELKRNEEELNKIFTDIYGLDNEVSYKVENKYISVKRVSAADDVKSLISYAVGCMFGRYSLDRSGLICAGRRFDIGEYSRNLSRRGQSASDTGRRRSKCAEKGEPRYSQI